MPFDRCSFDRGALTSARLTGGSLTDGPVTAPDDGSASLVSESRDAVTVGTEAVACGTDARVWRGL